MARDIRPHGNLVGAQIRRLRCEQGLSQPALAAKCQRLGWDVGRDIIARIEGQVRLVTDSELVFLARSLGVQIEDLFPKSVTKQLLREKGNS
jgi:transcriptional regulator with XRE-family HTH domain